MYAAEVRRLQQVVKNLKSVNGRIGLENRAARHLKAKNHHLEVMNLFLSSCLSASLRQTPRIPRTTKTPARRDALIENSFVDLDDVQQRRKNGLLSRNKATSTELVLPQGLVAKMGTAAG